MEPTKVTGVARQSIYAMGESVEANQEFEVLGAEHIGQILSSPPAKFFVTMNVHYGKDVEYNVSDGYQWSYKVEKKVADEAVKEARPEVEKAEKEKHAKRAKARAEGKAE